MSQKVVDMFENANRNVRRIDIIGIYTSSENETLIYKNEYHSYFPSVSLTMRYPNLQILFHIYRNDFL